MMNILLNASKASHSVAMPLLRRVGNGMAVRGLQSTAIGLAGYYNGGRDGDRNGGYRNKRSDANYGNRQSFNNGGGDRYGGRNNNYNNRRGGYGRNNRNDMSRREPDDSLKSSKFTKVVVVPKEDTESTITLDSLHEEKILNDDLYEAVNAMGFPSLTPVQQKTIKPILENDKVDVITRAKTGTGKTFAFLLPIMEHLMRSNVAGSDSVRSVIVAPTRDLALQIEEELRKIYSKNRELRKFGSLSLVGGTDYRRAIRILLDKQPSIVIGTPGRLIQTLDEYGEQCFKDVDFKVLDEADRLLEIGFKTDLEYISSTLNKLNSKGEAHIRTLLFSATLDDKVQILANDIMNKDECLFLDTVDKNAPEAHENIDQSVVMTDSYADSLFATIQHIKNKVDTEPEYKAILFSPTVKLTTYICNRLYKVFGRSFPILEFHGKISQARRTYLVKDFKKIKSGLLVCTDVGARGMDFPNVGEVLQLGVPTELANYVHRIGRTARAGKEGASILFMCKDELPFIETLRSEKKIEIKHVNEYEKDEDLVKTITDHPGRPYEVKEAILSVMSSYQACQDNYRFNGNKLFPNIAGAYGALLSEPGLKIPFPDRSKLQMFGFARARFANEIFDFDAQKDDEGSHGDDYQKSSRGSNYGRNSYNNRDGQTGYRSFNGEKRNYRNNRSSSRY
ncbi:hypothetical protein TPHA_0L00960 [Tetrapisispora phaffii CBS 4417]|uniref:ATP-dependent RNA helicase n=1 Tax=Tetrapisispora phaffii (strain ATCC 24235 / CBS 4417 / NBRC 1672 / NRRL Y-8282 / UCD 70-5) TaxID=1071381 RepID=G8BZX5_TETPH|nr:hypothetical protein TPHA_0L00960 [Tetrapisispora phaffii CBS 4417]CCE65453.1 hypothetical protein TPHA_0L00960 [Tetrapisispora phaffii CBS 4417]